MKKVKVYINEDNSSIILGVLLIIGLMFFWSSCEMNRSLPEGWWVSSYDEEKHYYRNGYFDLIEYNRIKNYQKEKFAYYQIPTYQTKDFPNDSVIAYYNNKYKLDSITETNMKLETEKKAIEEYDNQLKKIQIKNRFLLNKLSKADKALVESILLGEIDVRHIRGGNFIHIEINTITPLENNYQLELVINVISEMRKTNNRKRLASEAMYDN